MVTMFHWLILKRDFKKRHALYELIGLNISHHGSPNNKVNAHRSKSCISSRHMNLFSELKPPKGWTIRCLMGGLCKSQKKYRACASGLKEISCRIVKKEKNIEQP